MRGCACRGTSGVAHVSCLVEQAKILFAEAEYNNLDWEVCNERWHRWDTCSLCEQRYHGVVKCALGWACWKTYLGRPERDQARLLAVGVLGSGLSAAGHEEEALSVKEADLSSMRRIGASESSILIAQTCLANTYTLLRRNEQASNMLRDVYSARVRLNGDEHEDTIVAALNYAASLGSLRRAKEAKSLLRKTVPMARRVLGESDETTLRLRSSYAAALCQDDCATLDDLREAVNTLEEVERTARRVLGGSHPLTRTFEDHLRDTRVALAAREDLTSISDAVGAL